MKEPFEFSVPTDSTMFASMSPGDVHLKMIGALTCEDVDNMLADMNRAIASGWQPPTFVGDDYYLVKP